VASLGSFARGSQGKDLPCFRLIRVALILILILIVLLLVAVFVVLRSVLIVFLILVQVVVEIILETEAGCGETEAGCGAMSEDHDAGSTVGLAFSRFGGG
jgi:hypothetical protein